MHTSSLSLLPKLVTAGVAILRATTRDQANTHLGLAPVCKDINLRQVRNFHRSDTRTILSVRTMCVRVSESSTWALQLLKTSHTRLANL